MMAKKSSIKVASAIKKFAGKMADKSCGAASYWGMYQTKEPAARKKS